MDDARHRFERRARRATDDRRLVRQVEAVGVQCECRVGDHRAHIVGAAGAQGHRDEFLRAFLGVGEVQHRLFDRRILEHAAQAVGAQQQAVASARRADRNVWARVDVEVAEHAHHHIALRVVACLGLADALGVDEVLHVAVVVRQAHQVAVAQ